jgi:ubiquinone/menaquinone biosynthesis C-methylase UbiE
MNNPHPKSEFTDVDRANIPQNYVECLDAQRSIDFVRKYKQRVRTLLAIQSGQQILEIGAGTGEDTQGAAKLVGPTGHVIGLDFSQTMVEEARQRTQGMNLPAHFVQGDVQHLSFADDTFDRCYADRTFQHLPEPEQALIEMIRVTKPGGLLLIVDPDHETSVLDTPYPDVTRRFFRFRNDGMRQPGIAHQLYALFKKHGLQDVRIEPLTRVATDYEIIRPVARYIEGMRSAQQFGAVTAEEAEKWIAYVEDAISRDRFFHAVTYFITTGYKQKR